MSVQIRDESYAMSGRVKTNVTWRGTDPAHRWLQGTVKTPYGIVEVLVCPEDRYSRLDYVLRGVHHIRTWRGVGFSYLGIVRKASQFAESVNVSRATR